MVPGAFGLGQAVEGGGEGLDGRVRAADHNGEAVLVAPDSPRGAGVDQVVAGGGESGGPDLGLAKVGVAAINDDAALGQDGEPSIELGINDVGWDHEPEDGRVRAKGLGHIGFFVSGFGAVGDGLVNRLGVTVVGYDVMTGFG